MDMDKYIGRLLDNRYEILEVIGIGGMAVVYKARCHRLNRLVAVKILKDEFSQDEEFRQRFHAEGQAVAMLSHPNIVSVYDVSTSDAADYIVMELIDGITLKQYMEKKGVLNWKETLHFAIQIGKALDHAHSRGIIHRDIKPHNVMVLKNGSVKVADFGIARVMSKSNTLTKEALGSVHYISPEQAKGGRVDNRSDIYSLGVVMYEMMTGRPPYDGESPVSVAIQHINGNAPMPSTLNPNIPGGLEQIIMKAMALSPADRYPTATAMLYDMDEFRKDPTILFDYNNTSTGLDDATKIHSNAAPVPPVMPTTAEKTAARAGNGPRKASQPKKRAPAARREEIVEAEERGSKLATVAIVACTLVALVAIGIFLATFLGDNGIEQNQDMIMLPNLLNQPLEEAAKAKDYEIKVDKHIYSSEYEKGRIIEQKPKANTRIEKGYVVMVVVSMGPEPDEKIMEDFISLPLEQAKNFLINTQGVDESRIGINYESSTEVDEGRIIRTDPVKGEALPADGMIRLTVSKGPPLVTVPNVVEQRLERAYTILGASNFKNIRVQEVESSRPSGEVVDQHPKSGVSYDVTREVVLYVSKMTESRPPVPPINTDQPDDYVGRLVTVKIPESVTENCILTVFRGDELVEEREIPAGTVSTEFMLYGKGIMDFTMYISDDVQWAIEVDFNESKK